MLVLIDIPILHWRRLFLHKIPSSAQIFRRFLAKEFVWPWQSHCIPASLAPHCEGLEGEYGDAKFGTLAGYWRCGR